MDQSAVGAETFVLKTNLHCQGRRKEIKKLLQDIRGVHRISLNAAEGKITILGTIDPRTLIKILQKYGIKSELLSINQKDFRNSPVHNYHVLHDKEVVKQVQNLSKIKGLKSIAVTPTEARLTFKEKDNVQYYFDGENDSCSARQKTHECDHFRESSSCTRNQAMYCNGYGRPTDYRCMASHENIATGIPVSEYSTPSAPPVPPEYYPEMPNYDHASCHIFSDDHPADHCIVM